MPIYTNRFTINFLHKVINLYLYHLLCNFQILPNLTEKNFLVPSIHYCIVLSV